MTADEFNERWGAFLEEGHYGLAINDPDFCQWLDRKFEEFSKRPGFAFSQIKAKFGMGRFYAEGLTAEEVREVEQEITKLCKIQKQ